MSGQGRKWALGLGLPWHYARLALKAWTARETGAQAPARRILVLGYEAIGDLVFFMPFLRALRRGFPGARVVFVADRYAGTEEVLPASGLVDEIWLYEHSELAAAKTRRAIAARVRDGNFDAVVASGPTPMRAFAAAALEVPARVGHCRPLTARRAGWSALRYAWWRLRRGVVSEEFERRLVFNRKVWVDADSEHSVRRNLKLAEALGVKLTPSDEAPPEIPEPAEAGAFAERELAGGGRPLIGLHLGSPRSQYAKIWPARRWAAVAARATSKDGARLVLLGGPEEKETAAEFAAAYGKPFIDLTGRCRLLESLAVVRRCDLFLCNDTGLGKAAMAMGVPTTTVWGPSDRPGWGIFWDKEKHMEIFHALPCAPCVRLGLRNEGAGVINFSNCGHRACLSDLSEDEVGSAVLKRYGALLS